MNCTCSTRIKIKKQNKKAFWHALVANKGWEEKGQQNFVALTQIFEETDLKLQASGPSTHEKLRIVTLKPKLYITSTLNIALILWHTQLNVCAENVKSWFKSWVFHFTFQAYNLPHVLNCMCVSLIEFHIWISEQF